MVDTKKKYLDKVVTILVRDTEIDYEREEIYCPFYQPHRCGYQFSSAILTSHMRPMPSISSYLISTYGLDEDELRYVWDQYRGIIKDKIKSNV
jgi:hypothetical protein